MAADNHTTIIGNLVEDPEVRFTNNGIAVTNLRVAVTQRIQQDGEWRDGDTSFFKGQRLARPGREPGRLPRQGGPGDGHRPAAPAQLGDARGRQAVGHRTGGRRGRRLPQVGHGQGRTLEPARQRRPHPGPGAPSRTRWRLQRPGALLEPDLLDALAPVPGRRLFSGAPAILAARRLLTDWAEAERLSAADPGPRSGLAGTWRAGWATGG